MYFIWLIHFDTRFTFPRYFRMSRQSNLFYEGQPHFDSIYSNSSCVLTYTNGVNEGIFIFLFKYPEIVLLWQFANSCLFYSFIHSFIHSCSFHYIWMCSVGAPSWGQTSNKIIDWLLHTIAEIKLASNQCRLTFGDHGIRHLNNLAYLFHHHTIIYTYIYTLYNVNNYSSNNSTYFIG